MALPPIQQPVYGDRTKLAKLGSLRMTSNPAADVQQVKEMAGGRPSKRTMPDYDKIAQQAVRGNAPAMVAEGQPAGPIPGEHEQLLRGVAYLQHVAETWARIASQPDAGPVTRAYAVAAIRSWRAALERARSETPFFAGLDQP